MEIDELFARAEEVWGRAYAPYSGFHVGAALEAESGEVFLGCNVENISYGLTLCAERVALGAAVSAGYRKFVRVALYTRSSVPVSPCGACRQVLAEFAPDLEVVSRTAGGEEWREVMGVLLPRPHEGILDVPRGT